MEFIMDTPDAEEKRVIFPSIIDFFDDSDSAVTIQA
jgi:hypothetical protein